LRGAGDRLKPVPAPLRNPARAEIGSRMSQGATQGPPPARLQHIAEQAAQAGDLRSRCTRQTLRPASAQWDELRVWDPGDCGEGGGGEGGATRHGYCNEISFGLLEGVAPRQRVLRGEIRRHASTTHAPVRGWVYGKWGVLKARGENTHAARLLSDHPARGARWALGIRVSPRALGPAQVKRQSSNQRKAEKEGTRGVKVYTVQVYKV
jgi:hypothetical protein